MFENRRNISYGHLVSDYFDPNYRPSTPTTLYNPEDSASPYYRSPISRLPTRCRSVVPRIRLYSQDLSMINKTKPTQPSANRCRSRPPLAESGINRRDISRTQKTMDKTCKKITEFRKNLNSFVDFLKTVHDDEPQSPTCELTDTRGPNLKAILRAPVIVQETDREVRETEREDSLDSDTEDISTLLKNCINNVTRVKKELSGIKNVANLSFQ